MKETSSGIVVKPEDHEALVKAILYMKSNPGIARGFGENGREYVEENLSLKRIGHEMIRLLNRILKH